MALPDPGVETSPSMANHARASRRRELGEWSRCSATPASAAWSASRRRWRICSCGTTTSTPRSESERCTHEHRSWTAPPAHEAGQRCSSFTGTWLLRLYLRRDRLSPRCGSCCCRCRWPRCTSAHRGGVPDPGRPGLLAASIMASPAQRAMYGEIYNDTLGAVGIWKAGMFHLFIAVAVILTVIRHTSADEEAGRTD